MADAIEQAVITHEVKKASRIWSGVLQALTVAAIVALVSDRVQLGNEIKDVRLDLHTEVGKLRADLAAMGAARVQIVEDYRLNMARLEGQIEAARRDIQGLTREVASLAAELRSIKKD